MSRFAKLKFICAAFALGAVTHADSALACAACYGNSDSPLAKAMNWGIFSLLIVVVGVLGAVASFFIYLAKRAAAIEATATQGDLTASTLKS